MSLEILECSGFPIDFLSFDFSRQNFEDRSDRFVFFCAGIPKSETMHTTNDKV